MVELADNPLVAEAAANLAQALAHPMRLQILELLRDEGAYVMHMTTILGRPQANVSQHLAILRAAGLVVDEREGMTVIYRVRDPHLFDLVDCLKAVAAPLAEPGQSHRRGARWQTRRAGPQRNCRCPRCRCGG